MLVSVIILNYNGSDDTLECLHSLEDQTFRDLEVILVDNHSKNDEFKKLQAGVGELNLKIELFRLDDNLGFCGGNNFGASIAKGEYLIFLNNDTVVDKFWLENLIKPLRDEDVATSTCMVKYYDDLEKIQCCGGGALNIFGQLTHNPKETKIVAGVAFALKKGVLERIGELFPEQFFCYFEEVDLSWRIFNLGYKQIYVNDAIVYHKIAMTTKKEGIEWIAKLNSRNKYLTFYRNLHRRHLLTIFPLLLFYDMAFIFGLLVFRGEEGRKRAKGIIKGIYEFLKIKKEKSKLRNGIKFLEKRIKNPWQRL